MKKLSLSWGFVLTGLLAMLVTTNCGGGSSSDEEEEPQPEPGATITFTGQAAVRASDLASLSVPSLSGARATYKKVPLKFVTIADTPLDSATVTLFKMNADETEEQVDIGTVTTDAEGDYTIPDVPVAEMASGAATDFYYEVRITKDDLTIVSPTAAQEDSTVDVSPETHLAAKMLTDVSNAEGQVLPRAETVENLRNLTTDEIVDNLSDAIVIPTLTDDEAMVIAATAVGADSGNAEKALRIFEAEKNHLALESSTDVDAVGAYLEKITKRGCDFNENFSLPESARDLMAEAFIADETMTPDELVDAFNNNNGNDADVIVADKVADADEIFTAVDDAVTNGTEIPATTQVALLIKRDLSADTFDETTELKIDQSLSFVQSLFQQSCQPGNFDMIGFVSDLTGEEAISEPSIIDRQIFQDMGFNCNGNNVGHLRAEVKVYAAGGATVNGVSLTKEGTERELTQDGQNGPFSRWTLNGDGNLDPDFFCMDLPGDISYTITVDLEGAADLTETVTANHREVREASITYVGPDGTETEFNNDQNVFVVTEKRPFLKWDPPPGFPGDDVIADAPEGSEIKYTFSWSYFLTDPSAAALGYGGNEPSLSQCARGGNDNILMDRNYFISDDNCDPEACLADLQETGTAQIGTGGSAVTVNADQLMAEDIICHTNLQTFLVDENDRYLGQAAGNFRDFCYDSNSDGDCGN